MQIACQANITDAAERQSSALYEAGCEIGQLIDLIDMMIETLDEDWTDPAATLRQMAGVSRLARGHAARTLATVLAAEGAEA